MAIIESSMLPLGTTAPPFSLIAPLDGKFYTLDALKSKKGTVIMFICNHCPFVKQARPEFIRIAHQYQKKGISFVAINSNDPTTYPDDAPDKMADIAREFHFDFPYLFDESQDVARAYHAVCTPDFFVFDGELKCVYRGQLDDSRPNNGISPTGKDLREALDCLLKGLPISPTQKPSMGCSIKWKRT